MVIDLSLASSSPFELWSLYIFHISIFFNFNFQCFLLFLGWFFLSWSLCSIVAKMTMYLSLDYGWIMLNWKTIINHYSLVSAMKKIKDLGDRFLLVFHKNSHLSAMKKIKDLGDRFLLVFHKISHLFVYSEL